MKTYAGFWQRVKAFAFDYLIILGYLVVITLLFLIINRFSSGFQWLFASRIQAQVIGLLLLTLPVTLYFAISESSNRQATWGKQRMGLRVADDNGERISFLRPFSRTLLKFVPWELSHTLVWNISFATDVSSTIVNYGFGLIYVLIGLNIASLVMKKKRQTLYDLIAKTYVVTQAS
jgi:uncharacterized RDD family membrane protein YckC